MERHIHRRGGDSSATVVPITGIALWPTSQDWDTKRSALVRCVGCASMTKANNKARSDAIQHAARALLAASQADITQQVDLSPLAAMLVQQTGCHPDTAKRHIARAVRLARGEGTHDRTWGGVRRGERAAITTATARAGHIAWATLVTTDGVVDLGRGTIQVERTGQERCISVALPSGETLRLMLF